MNSPQPAFVPAQRRDWTRRLVNLLVALVVIAIAAAAFVFSYDGVHATALLGGVSKQLARYYPGLFDAVLVIASVAAVMLRDGRWWARLWAWVVVIVVLAAIGATDVLHAINYTLPHRTTEGIVAAAPAVAVLLAFSLLLTLLRRSRTPAPEPAAPAPVPLDVPALPAAVSVAPIALPAAPVAQVAAAPVAGPVEAETVPLPLPEDRPLPAAAPTREDRVIVGAPEAPQAAVPDAAAPEPAAPEPAAPEPEPASRPAPEPAAPEPAHPVTEPNAVIAPSAEAAAEEPAEEPPVREPHGIRYAGSGVRGMAGQQPAAEDDTPPSAGYWESAAAGPLAGLVYPAREDQANPDDTGDAEGAGDGDAGDAKADEPAPRKNPPELDDDAPPFATAPFASVPRLNRVRSTPTPPADEDD
jgi:hypothetical protein